MHISTLAELRGLYAAPMERAVKKQLPALDVHCQRFIALSPFVVMATGNVGNVGNGDDGSGHVDHGGAMDASPRGGEPGFVQVLDEHTLLIPDAPGNNRLDSLQNIVTHGEVGLLFLIPGVDETLRVNGSAVLSLDEADISRCATAKRRPGLVIRVTVRDAYLHCAKALMRSQLWSPAALIDRARLPTAGAMLRDQTGIQTPPESAEEMRLRYLPDL